MKLVFLPCKRLGVQDSHRWQRLRLGAAVSPCVVERLDWEDAWRRLERGGCAEGKADSYELKQPLIIVQNCTLIVIFSLGINKLLSYWQMCVWSAFCATLLSALCPPDRQERNCSVHLSKNRNQNNNVAHTKDKWIAGLCVTGLVLEDADGLIKHGRE